MNNITHFINLSLKMIIDITLYTRVELDVVNYLDALGYLYIITLLVDTVSLWQRIYSEK